jgi:hypothetical protein
MRKKQLLKTFRDLKIQKKMKFQPINIFSFIRYSVLFYFWLFIPIHSIEDPPQFYKTLLTEAEFYYLENRPEISQQKLDILFSRYPTHLEFGYYHLLGKIKENRQDMTSAMEAYEKAIKLNPKEDKLALKIFDFYIFERKLQNAFNFGRIYLSLNPDDPIIRYKTMVLASRLGERKYFLFAERKLGKFDKKENKEDILKQFEELSKANKYEEGYLKSKELLPYYASDFLIHKYFRTFHKNSELDQDREEEYLINTAAIFWKDPIPSYNLALYYMNTKNYYKALNLFRRMYSQSLTKNKENLDEEILYSIRNCYFHLKDKSQIHSIDSLIRLHRQFQKTKTRKEDEVYSLYLNTKNRETLVYLIHFFETKKFVYLTQLKERDNSKGDSEFMNVFPLFDFEEAVEEN